MDTGGKSFLRITAGPAAPFVICGISGGRDGRRLVVYNTIAQNMTIANDSGVDPVTANRILTCTGADITITNQGCVTLIYSVDDGRWIVTSTQY